MAVSLTKVTGADTVFGNKRVKVRDCAFSGNYTTGGETILPATVGLAKIDFVLSAGAALSTDLVTSNPVTYNNATGKLLQYESGASSAASIEKSSGEAYATGSSVRLVFVGY